MSAVVKALVAGCVLSVAVSAVEKKETILKKEFVAAPEAKYLEGKVEKVEVAPLPFCKDGSEYGPQGCAIYETAEMELSCPKPYKMDKSTGQCLTKTYGESATVCPKGTELDGKHCVSEIVQPAEEYCKKGELSKQGCLVYGEEKVVAPKYKDAKYDCPKGYKLDGEQCYKDIKEDSDYVCEKGYDLDGKKCVTVETASLECKKGQLVKGDCVETDVADVVQSCPKGSKSDGKGCYEVVTSEATAVCEKGYELDKKEKKCITEVLIQAMPTKKGESFKVDCHGKTDEKGNCYQTHKSDVAWVCEKGFEMDKHGKKCESIAHVEAEYECPKGYETAATGKKADCIKTKVYKPKCPKGFKQSDKGLCVKTLKEKPSTVCPKGTDESKGKCYTVDVVPASVSCPKDYDLQKDGCVKEGWSKAGEDKVYKSKFSCPKGFKLDGEDCIAYEKSKPTVVCEKGYDLDGKKCIAVHAVAPQAMCPKGFVGGKGKDACTRVTYDKVRFECPKGSEDHGKKCYISQEVDAVKGAYAPPAQKK